MLLISLYLLHSLSSSEPDITPFGTNLGSNNGVIGYSNGNCDYTSNKDAYIGDIYSGMEWQCVEYARRWLIATQSLTFASVNCASDIWHLNHLSSATNNKHHTSLYRIPNGSRCPPSSGDIIIYKLTETNPVGHVAIITNVDDDEVQFSEQNWDNDYWPGNYSRTMPLSELSGFYYLLDFENPIFGWMSYKRPEDIACADIECVTCTPVDEKKETDCKYL
jgi:hypothetical protein